MIVLQGQALFVSLPGGGGTLQEPVGWMGVNECLCYVVWHAVSSIATTGGNCMGLVKTGLYVDFAYENCDSCTDYHGV